MSEFDEYYGLGEVIGPSQQFYARGTVGPPPPGLPPRLGPRTVGHGVPGPYVPENRSFWRGGTTSTSWINRANDPNNVVFNPEYGVIGPQSDTPTSRSFLASPVLNQRPDLSEKTGADPATAVSLWRGWTYGQGANLAMQVTRSDNAINLMGSLAQDLHVYMITRGSVLSPDQMTTLGLRESVTCEFRGGGQSSVLMFALPDPALRYWQAILVLDWLGDAGLEPQLLAHIQAT